MYYLTDNPWPAVIVLSGLAIAAFITGNSVMRKLALVMAVAAGSVYLIEQAVVSKTEQIEVSANAILEGFQNEDIDQISERISVQSPDLIATAKRGLQMVGITDSFHIRSIKLKSESSDEAVIGIRANGNIHERTHSMSQRVAEFWETTWVNESETWKLKKAVRLDPISGEPRGTFDRN